MQAAWQSACAYESASDAVLQPLDLENAELLCCINSGGKSSPTRPDKRWFCDAYCDGHGIDRSAAESPWDLVTTPAPIEAIAMVACAPALAQRFYEPHVIQLAAGEGKVQGSVEHRVIGASATALASPALSDFLREALCAGVRRPPTDFACVRQDRFREE